MPAKPKISPTKYVAPPSKKKTEDRVDTMNLFEVMDEVLKCKDDLISIRKDLLTLIESLDGKNVQIADLKHRMNRLETRVGIPR